MSLKPEDIRRLQAKDTAKETFARKAAADDSSSQSPTTTLPVRQSTAVQRYETANQYLEETAPTWCVGRLIKFSHTDGKYIAKDGEAFNYQGDFICLADETMVGRVRFYGPGMPPERHMGPLFGGYIVPPRDSLGENDSTQWKTGLNGEPEDPWQEHNYVVLESVENGDLVTFATSSPTGRRAVGLLLKSYIAEQKRHPDTYPLVRLKHQDKTGPNGLKYKVPLFVVVGRTPKDSAAKPDTSLAADMSDAIPF
jgi:hypothetical protein